MQEPHEQGPDTEAGPGPEAAAAGPASLRGRLSGRRRALTERKPFYLPVPGYEEILRAKYRAIDYRALRRIGLKQADNPDQPESEINVAADSLVQACQGLYEVPEDWDGHDESLRETGYAWEPRTAHELFGVEHDELPDGSTGRAALLRIIPDHTEVVLHYAEFDRASRRVGREVDEAIQGESGAP